MAIKLKLIDILRNIKKIDDKWKDIRETSRLKKVLKFFPSNIFILLFLLCSMVICVNEYLQNNNIIIYRDNQIYVDNVGAIYDKSIDFDLERKNVKSDFDILSIKFATYQRKNDSDYNIKVLDNDSVIYEKDFNTKNFEDNEYVDFYLEENIDKNRLKDYTVKITPLKTDVENNITVFCDNQTKDVAVAYKKEKSILNFSTIFIVIWVILLFGSIRLIEMRKLKHEQYLLVAMVFIFFSSIITPPYQVPDERIHFLRAYQLSQYDFSETPYDNLNIKSISVPENLHNINYSLVQSRDAVNDFEDVLNSFKSTENVLKTYDSSISGSAVIFAYIIPAFFINITDYFSNSPIVIFYVGRIACLLLNFMIIYLALKVIPVFKNTLLIVALMPMSIQSLISYSYDGLLNAICFLFIALCVKMIVDESNLDKRDFYKYLALSILLLMLIISIKLPYGLLGVIYCFLPFYKSTGRLLKKVLTMLFACGAAFGLNILVTKLLSIGTPMVSLGAVAATTNESNFNYILNNPMQIVTIAKNTFKIKREFYIDSLIGYFGYFTIKFNSFFQYLYAMFFGVLAVSEKNILKRKEKIIYFITLCIIMGGIFAALYFVWTDYQGLYVEGVQGRYFLPLLLPFMLTICTKNKKLRVKNEMVFEYSIILIISYLVVIFVHYF